MPRGGPVATRLADVQSQFHAISDRTDRIVAAVGNDLITVRSRSTAWSIAECLIHLTLSAEAYLPTWRARVQPCFRAAC